MSSQEILELQKGEIRVVRENEELLEHRLNKLSYKKRKRVCVQLSMCGTSGDMAWERRRRQTQRRRNSIHDCDDEDLNELRGCIELGFGFNEEDGQKLCNTLPALDLYFAVNRQLSSSPVSTPTAPRHATHRRASSSFVCSTNTINVDSDSLQICSPGNNHIINTVIAKLYILGN